MRLIVTGSSFVRGPVVATPAVERSQDDILDIAGMRRRGSAVRLELGADGGADPVAPLAHARLFPAGRVRVLGSAQRVADQVVQ
jgi:hypothetical protein